MIVIMSRFYRALQCAFEGGISGERRNKRLQFGTERYQDGNPSISADFH